MWAVVHQMNNLELSGSPGVNACSCIDRAAKKIMFQPSRPNKEALSLTEYVMEVHVAPFGGSECDEQNAKSLHDRVYMRRKQGRWNEDRSTRVLS